MTIVTDRVKEGVTQALRFIEGGESVRKACDKAGISVTSLYHNSSAQERNAAFLKNSETVISPDQATIRGRRRRKVYQRKNMISGDAQSLRKQLDELNEYVYKLEKKLIQTVVLNDNSH
jgi:hypothetical protein